MCPPQLGWAQLLSQPVCAAGFPSLPLLFFPLILKTQMTQTPAVFEQGEGSWSPQSHEVRGAAALTGTAVSLWQRLHPWLEGSPLREHPKSSLACCVLLGSSRKFQENCFGNGDGSPSFPHVLAGQSQGQQTSGAAAQPHAAPCTQLAEQRLPSTFPGFGGDQVPAFLPVCFPC